jgi:GABA(A) receptor-associated protein
MVSNENYYKNKNPFEDRRQEIDRIRRKYPGRIPCYIYPKEGSSKYSIIDKNKFIVPDDLTISQLMYVIRKRIKLLKEDALFFLINGQSITGSSNLGSIYAKHKDPDGFLYITYSLENTFGNFFFL